jgi:hypothetical protein
MSLLAKAERLAGQYLPPTLKQRLQHLRDRLPTRLALSAPVVQMFIDDADTRSFVGLHNFYSCLLPEVETAADVELRFYAPTGKLIARTSHELAQFAAQAVDVKAVLAAKRVDVPHGVVTAQITPRAPRRKIYRELGRVSAHFFVFFRDAGRGCVEQTHPLSTTDPTNAPSQPFTSSQVLSTAKLRQLVAFQYNPGPRPHTLEHSLVDMQSGEVVARLTHAIPPLGSVRSVFTLAELRRVPDQLLFCVDALPAANAKPMLRRVFDGGRHSMSHA